jgi:hypothetical protein
LIEIGDNGKSKWNGWRILDFTRQQYKTNLREEEMLGDLREIRDSLQSPEEEEEVEELKEEE